MKCCYYANVLWIEVSFDLMDSIKYCAIVDVEKFEQHASADEKCPHLC